MKLRFILRASLATFTLAAASASAASGNLWIACGIALCAAFIVVAPIARQVSRDDVKSLVELLRLSQQAGAPAVNAVVTPFIIFIGKSVISGDAQSGYIPLFRDEVDDPVWREMATLLRHQVHPSAELGKVGQSAGLPLGKSSDL